jgi:hypothetical protein
MGFALYFLFLRSYTFVSDHPFAQDRSTNVYKPSDLLARRERVRERGTRRQHDEAMNDQRVAAEHRIANDRARARGNPGCQFCDAGGSARERAGRFASRLRHLTRDVSRAQSRRSASD